MDSESTEKVEATLEDNDENLPNSGTSGVSEFSNSAQVACPYNYTQGSSPGEDNSSQSERPSNEGDDISLSDTIKEGIQASRIRILPVTNCMEKIIICVDVCSETDSSNFKLSDGKKFSPLHMMKRIIEIFVHSKHTLDNQHQYALVLLHEEGIWLSDFTNDPREVVSDLSDVREAGPYNSFNLTSLFDLIQLHVDLPQSQEPTTASPPYIIRTVLMYGRSYCIPKFCDGVDSYESLMASPYFTMDLLYVHEPPSPDNQCKEIFDCLCKLDDGLGYVFEVGRNATKLHILMAKLLAHPLQRPLQPASHHRLPQVINIDE